MRSDEAAATSEADEVGVSHFRIVHETQGGRFHWELINPHGTAMGRSMETFDSADEAEANAKHVRQLIAQAPITRS